MADVENEPQLGEDEYSIARISGTKTIDGTRYYLIEWEGYEKTDNTWERENNVYSSASISQFFEEYSQEAGCSMDSLPMESKLLLLQTYDPDTKQYYTPSGSKHLLNSTSSRSKRHREIYDSELDGSNRGLQDIRRNFKSFMLEAPADFQNSFDHVINSVDHNHPLARAPNHQRIRNFPLYVIKNLKTKLTVYNDIDSSLPNDFIYTDQLLYIEPVQQPDSNFLSGCSCLSKNNCSGSCHDALNYDSKGRLLVTHGTAIYECNSACDCDIRCRNRVVQRGRQVPLQIFKTKKKGWGVRAAQTILKGTFVEEYIGEVITVEECDKRGPFYDKHHCSYLFDMDFAQNELPTKYAIDAFVMGNVSRFFNHSCSPNLEVYAVYNDSADVQMHRLAFFASKNIKKDEEMCFDYNGRRELDESSEKVDKSARYPCHCGAKSCRKWIYM